MRLRYWILTVIVVISLIAAMVLNTYGAWPGDAPTGTLTVMITEVDSGQVWTATTELEPQPLTQTIFAANPVPFTTYTPEVPPLEPNGEYVITFAVTTQIGNPQDISIITRERVWVRSDTIVHTDIKHFTGPNTVEANVVDNIKTDLDPTVSTTFTLPSYVNMIINETGGSTPILGKHINNSTFSLKIWADGTDIDGYPAAQTLVTADIVISVLEPTEMVLIVVDVSATVTGG